MMVVPGGRAVMMYAVEHDVTRRATQRLPLPDRLLVDLAVHNDHHQPRDPEGHARADYRVRTIHHERAGLEERARVSKFAWALTCVNLTRV